MPKKFYTERDIGASVAAQEIILEKRVVTADIALRLARYFGTPAHFWLGLQMDYDLDVAEDALDDRIRLASR